MGIVKLESIDNLISALMEGMTDSRLLSLFVTQAYDFYGMNCGPSTRQRLEGIVKTLEELERTVNDAN